MLHALIQLVESDDGPFQQDCLSQFSLNIDNFGAVARLEHLAKIDLTLQLKQNAYFCSLNYYAILTQFIHSI